MLPSLIEAEPSLVEDNIKPTQKALEDAWVKPEDRLQAQESIHTDSSSERVPRADESASWEQKDDRDVSPKIAPSTTKRSDSAATLLTDVDPRNIITVLSDEENRTPLENTSRMPSTRRHSRTLRTRNTKQIKLNYDQKYHPMDDSIRPSHAAKRRFMHREEFSSDDSSNSYSKFADSDTESASEDGSEDDRESMSVKKGKKRTRSEVDLLQPARRSLRKTSNPKVSYSMKVHPQDNDLEMLSEETDMVEVPASKRRKHDRDGSHKFLGPSDQTEFDCGSNTSANISSGKDLVFQIPSSSLSTAIPPQYMVHGMERLDIWERPLSHRNSPHKRNARVILSSQDFEIFAEPLEDQLEREANASSPLSFAHDDKENLVNNPDFEPASNPLEGITVIPASQHRQTIEDNYVSGEISVAGHALYDMPGSLSCPYGLGGGDGAQDEDTLTANGNLKAERMRIFRSSDQLPKTPTRHQYQGQTVHHDSVLGSSSSTTVDVDSVIGALSSLAKST